MVEDEDGIIVESSKNLPKITEDGSDMIDYEDDDAISILDESDADVETDNELEEINEQEMFSETLDGSFKQLSNEITIFTFINNFFEIIIIIDSLLNKIRAFITKIHRSNPLFLHVNKKKLNSELMRI